MKAWEIKYKWVNIPELCGADVVRRMTVVAEDASQAIQTLQDRCSDLMPSSCPAHIEIMSLTYTHPVEPSDGQLFMRLAQTKHSAKVTIEARGVRLTGRAYISGYNYYGPGQLQFGDWHVSLAGDGKPKLERLDSGEEIG